MKIYPFLCSLLLATATHQARADKNVLPFVNSKKAPADIRAKMPQGARSVRFGSDKIGKNNTEVLLHLYELKHIGYLDILQRTSRGRRRQLVRLNSLRLNMNSVEGTFDTYWLDPKQRNAPIIAVGANDGAGFGRAWSLHVFPQGLQGKVVNQVFNVSFSRSSDVLDYSIGEADSRGFVTVKETISLRTTIDDVPGEGEHNKKQYKEVVRFWNGDGFVQPKQVATADSST